MIITKISDGLGNQLFMYACGYAAAKNLQTPLLLDISYLDNSTLRQFELDKLNIQYKSIFSTRKLRFYPLKIIYRRLYHTYLKIKHFHFFREKQTYIFDSQFTKLGKKTYLFGYWQTEKYFKTYRSDFIRMFTPNYKLSLDCERYIKIVQQSNSVAIHVRRGDYVNLGICLDKSYYHQALLKIEEYVENPQYFIFSDDLEFSKHLFKEEKGEFTYIQYESTNHTLEDFFIMKSCKHIIMANSSFSWWAAWLNDNPSKIVIHPHNRETNDFYPTEWLAL